MYPSPYDFIFMLNFNTTTQTRKTFKMKLHHPIEKIELIKFQVSGNNIYYNNNYSYHCGEWTTISYTFLM